MTLMRYAPSTELEGFPAGLRLLQDSVSRLFSELFQSSLDTRRGHFRNRA